MDEFINFMGVITSEHTWVRVVMVLIGAGLIYLSLTRFQMIRWRA